MMHTYLNLTFENRYTYVQSILLYTQSYRYNFSQNTKRESKKTLNIFNVLQVYNIHLVSYEIRIIVLSIEKKISMCGEGGKLKVWCIVN